MSTGHQHMGGPSMTQNQGNVLGDRPCVTQSKLYREHLGGNAMKKLMGQDNLKWNTNKLEGAYAGNNAKGPASENEARRNQAQQQQQPQQASRGGAPWAQDDAPQQQQQRRGGGRGQVAPQEQPSMPSRQASEAGGVDAMKHRPGAGQANKQTFNIFGN